jgi:hypothetical protein
MNRLIISLNENVREACDLLNKSGMAASIHDCLDYALLCEAEYKVKEFLSNEHNDLTEKEITILKETIKNRYVYLEESALDNDYLLDIIKEEYQKIINGIRILPNYTMCLYNGQICMVTGNDMENSNEDLSDLNYYIKYGADKKELLAKHLVALYNNDDSYQWYDDMVFWNDVEPLLSEDKISIEDILK